MKRSRWAACLLALLVSVLVGQGVLSTPAQADGNANCIPIYSNGRIVFCEPILVEVAGWCPGCPRPCLSCLPEYALDFREYLTQPAYLRYQSVLELARGLGLLEQAARSQNSQLRRDALVSFISVVRPLGKNGSVRLEQAGYIDRAAGVVRPAGLSWLTSAGNHITEGLAIVQQYYNSPPNVPSPIDPERGLDKIDLARQELANRIPL
ncbi:hypothetical protein Skr01_46910 [Sphaerisporangium krabiense]|uniref:Uncharacterized protein n=1 Tax=Sphaerisporangium krabiense TaxID=763782 RepID=A0A7W8Z4I2_9ACTN|nr:hypothetical protein [Sphaerisporangium krabiense]MBB5627260.1 hypothetical protein [Sphaerisporangium krabiense]GII64606.1 hypothetical protein Skr01_46910 [Sphaerisporangium krabiense]